MPPTTLRADLSKEDVERVNGLRRQMWTRGAQGFGLGGLLGGYGCWSLMRLQHNYPSHSVARVLPKITGKHVLMWALLDAVTLSYFAVTYEGMKGAAAVRTKFEQGQRDATQASSPFDASKDLQSFGTPEPEKPQPKTHHDPRISRSMLEMTEAKRQVVKANEDSHARRLEAIEAKKRRDHEGGKSAGRSSW